MNNQEDNYDEIIDDDSMEHLLTSEELSKLMPIFATPRLTHQYFCMMEERGQYKMQISREENELYSKIMTAIRHGHITVLQYIHTNLPDFRFNFRYNLNPADSKKSRIMSPILYACECGQTAIVELLFEMLVTTFPILHPMTDKTKSEETALILAVSHTEVVDLNLIHFLLKRGYQNIGAKMKFKKTALHIACSNGLVEVVELILNYNNSWAAKGKVPPKVLLNAADMQDKHGNTPFLLAIKKNTERHRRIVRLWLEMERNPAMALKDPICEIPNNKGFYPAMVAAQTGQTECLKVMAEFNSLSDEACSLKTKNGWNIIHCAVASGNLELLQWLLKEKPTLLKIIDEPNKKGYTPFLMACEYCHLAVIHEFLLSRHLSAKIDFQKKAKDDLTCFHISALHDNSEVLDLLLRHFESENRLHYLFEQEAKYGDTLLHTALRRSSLNIEYRLSLKPEFVRHLKSMKNSNGQVPEDVRDPDLVPFVIRKRSEEHIRAYLKARQEGKTKNNHCNLVVLGGERVGKTSLIKGVLGMDFDPNCQPTQGVQLKEIETVAECFDIKLHDQEETWEAIDSPLDRIKEEYINSIAKAITVATDVDGDQTPVHPAAAEDTISQSSSERETALLSEVDNLIKIVKPQIEAAKEEWKKKKTDAADDDDDDEVVSKPQPSSKHRRQSNRPKRQKRITSTTIELTQAQISNLQKAMSHNESKAIVKKIRKKKTSSEASIIFHTIDFAGQSLYRPMHHCFITHRAVYIVVFKLTDLLKHIRHESLLNDPINELRYWLNNIIAHASEVNGKEDPPKIFLVGTHKNGETASTEHNDDQSTRVPPLTDQELEEINDELMSVFVSSDDSKRYRYAIQYTKSEGGNIVFAIENSLTPKYNERRRESGISLFMQRIDEIKVKIPFLKQEFPTSYIKFEEKILEMRKERKSEPLATTKKEVKEWAVECGINDQEADVNTAMEFYHDIRVIVIQDLITSPFKDRQPLSEFENDLVILSPQWLGDMMCKIMQLKIGNEDYDKDATILLNNAGIICEKDLEKCLLGKHCATDAERKSFKNLLNILESYCLICKLSKDLGELLKLKAGDDLHYLVPSKMPSKCKSKLQMPQDSYHFEFDFNSYLPHEVYIHCLCIILRRFSTNALPNVRKHNLELSSTSSTFHHIKLHDDLPFIDLKISFHEETHTLAFSICPYDKSKVDLFRYIVEVDEFMVSKVSRTGSLGCLSYKGGPSIKCSCVRDDQTVILPLVNKSIPGENIGSPDTPTCVCECGHKRYNVDEILKSQIQPINTVNDFTPAQVVQNFINLGGSSSSSDVVVASNVPPPQQPQHCSEQPSVTNISYPLMVKVAEEFHHVGGERLALYLKMKKQWNDIVSKQPPGDEIDNVVELLEMWASNSSNTKPLLKEILMMIDKQKATEIFSIL